MNSPEGWFRAQLLFQTLKAPPPTGSLQEWVLILYLDRLETIDHAKFRALSQIMLVSNADDQSAGTDAFEDYMKKAFPGVTSKKTKKHDELMSVLKDWVSKGPLSVTPMAAPVVKGKSKMLSRVSVEKGAVDDVIGKSGGIRSK